MKLPGERIDQTDYEMIPGYLYSDEDEDYFFTARNGVVTGVFQNLADFEKVENLRQELKLSDSSQEWLQAFE